MLYDLRCSPAQHTYHLGFLIGAAGGAISSSMVLNMHLNNPLFGASFGRDIQALHEKYYLEWCCPSSPALLIGSISICRLQSHSPWPQVPAAIQSSFSVSSPSSEPPRTSRGYGT